MLPTIVFFFALLFTYWLIIININLIREAQGMDHNLEQNWSKVIAVISCILWSWLFYLLH